MRFIEWASLCEINFVRLGFLAANFLSQALSCTIDSKRNAMSHLHAGQFKSHFVLLMCGICLHIK